MIDLGKLTDEQTKALIIEAFNELPTADRLEVLKGILTSDEIVEISGWVED